MKTRSYLVLILATLAISAAIHCSAQPQVSNLNDSGPGSLREAILAAASGDTIIFQSGLSGTITLTSGELAIGRNITILGPGATDLTVDGDANDRVFEITGTATVTIVGLTISNGFVSDSVNARGGGVLIDNFCTLTLSNCWVVRNTARGSDGSFAEASGGGIYNAGVLSLLGCTVSGNTAHGADGTAGGPMCGDGFAGGVDSDSGAAGLSNCTVAGNVAEGGSTGWAGPPGNAQGGGIRLAELKHCTVCSNSARGGWNNGLYGSAEGGGIWSPPTPNSILHDTIVAGNVAGPPGAGSGPDAYGPVYSNGFNLIGQTDGSSGWAPNDLTGTSQTPLDPLLGSLQNNGGPTPTMAPLPGSAAIDAGTSGGLTTDQRGLPRPSRFNGGNPLPPGGDGSDIGAVELQLVQLYIEPTLVAGQRQFTLYWQNTEPSYHLVRLLQTSRAGLLSSSWTISSLPIMTINGTNRAAITTPTNNAFFRLLLAP